MITLPYSPQNLTYGEVVYAHEQALQYGIAGNMIFNFVAPSGNATQSFRVRWAAAINHATGVRIPKGTFSPYRNDSGEKESVAPPLLLQRDGVIVCGDGKYVGYFRGGLTDEYMDELCRIYNAFSPRA